jgi:hypothetical protein
LTDTTDGTLKSEDVEVLRVYLSRFDPNGNSAVHLLVRATGRLLKERILLLALLEQKSKQCLSYAAEIAQLTDEMRIMNELAAREVAKLPEGQ